MPGLPNDWMPAERVKLVRDWNEHREVELLNQLKAEVDENGEPRWILRQEDDGDDPTWTAFWFRPVDPFDPRPSIRVTRYARSWADQQNADAQAIAREHADDD